MAIQTIKSKLPDVQALEPLRTKQNLQLLKAKQTIRDGPMITSQALKHHLTRVQSWQCPAGFCA